LGHKTDSDSLFKLGEIQTSSAISHMLAVPL